MNYSRFQNTNKTGYTPSFRRYLDISRRFKPRPEPAIGTERINLNKKYAEEAVKCFNEGLAHIKKEQWRHALDKFQLYLEYAPNTHYAVYQNMAICYRNVGDNKHAYEMRKKYEEGVSKNLDARLAKYPPETRAKIYLNVACSGAMMHSINLIKKYLEKSMACNETIQACEKFMEIGSQHMPLFADYISRLESGKIEIGKKDGLDQMILQRHDDLVKYAEIAKRLDPTGWKAYYYLGESFLTKKEFENAEKELKKALELSPGNKTILELLKVLEKEMTEKQ